MSNKLCPLSFKVYVQNNFQEDMEKYHFTVQYLLSKK